MKNFWNPNAATKIATSLVIGATVAFNATPPAEATTGHIRGYRATVNDSGRMDRPDSISVYGPQGKEVITVTCAPFDWNSYGANTVAWTNSIAETWCFGD